MLYIYISLYHETMEIKPTRSYYTYLWDNERYYYLLKVPVVFILFPFYFIYAKCALTFTNSLRIENGQLIVNYMKWFRNREIAFPLADTILELRQYHDDVRSLPYDQVAIRYQNKIRYTIDAREGFTRETLLAFMSDFTRAQLPAAVHHA